MSPDDMRNEEEQAIRDDLEYEIPNYEDELKTEFGEDFKETKDDDEIVDFILNQKFPDGFEDVGSRMEDIYGRGMVAYQD